MPAKFMRITAAVTLVLACLLAGPSGGATENNIGYLSVIDDLPLMPGMTEVAGSALVFDSPGGRIVEAMARGKVRRADVMIFYGSTLTQLGWREVAPGRFRREGEELRIEFPGSADSPPGAGLTVRFALSPAGGRG